MTSHHGQVTYHAIPLAQGSRHVQWGRVGLYTVGVSHVISLMDHVSLLIDLLELFNTSCHGNIWYLSV